ncbi:ribosome recycling factor [Aestuariivirga litoralis]|uniref:ribosome recycling factor n=1 Tax=Aestuariivirga litoralis TaxID=2650924 RepID=UPI0018C81850|nr:ribosome recycling factor [Aestuariivirga litoralis]MBG1231731.1 ribosome recycling factor [Aestuariivirga litoralis]
MAAPAPFNAADIKRRMSGAIDALKHDFGSLRTGRASPSLLDPIMVDAYGSKSPINAVGSVTVPEPRLLQINVWDRGLVIAVEKAIQQSNLGLNPQTEGQVIRLRMPDLTQDRRKELVKVAHTYAEKARVAVRNVRRDGMDQIKVLEKASAMGEDEAKDKSDEVQKMTDATIKDIDGSLKSKEAEIMQV